jgi:DNA-binding response OmpR family regulator
MVVDDDNAIREMLKIALATSYEVVCIPNGEEVLDAVENYRPNLILLDINLPGTDGFAICQDLRSRARSRNIPILFITVRKDDMSFIRSLEAGGDSVVTKPFEIPELRQQIEYLLKVRES